MKNCNTLKQKIKRCGKSLVGLATLTIITGTGFGCTQTIKLTPNMYGQISPAKHYGYQENKCAAYAVRVARQQYDKNMYYSNAWDISYNNKLVAKIKDNNHLKELIKNKTLTPGMIIGVRYPLSAYLQGKDKKGNKRKYTHLIVFAGTDNNGEPAFYHQFKDKEEKISLRNLKQISSKLVEIIDER